MAEFSLCMIVRNEEKVLARCLDSVEKLFDEIIICDTGSNDSTKEIAAEYTKNIYDFEWCDDFSAARNFAFSKATKDYIVWLDADDIINNENLDKLLSLKKHLSSNVDIVMLPYVTAFDENDKPAFSFYRERIIKNNTLYHWQGRVHEAISVFGNIIYDDAAIYHKSVKETYSKRNLLIYEKMIEENEILTPRDTFYYARELYYHGQHSKCRPLLKNFLKSNGWIENKIEACKILAYSYLSDGNETQAIHALTDSFEFDVPRAEICCELGYIFKNKNETEKAIFWFKTALQTQPKQNGAFISIDSSNFIPAIELAVCYDRLKDYSTANYYNELAGKYKPYDKNYLHNKDYFDRILAK